MDYWSPDTSSTHYEFDQLNPFNPSNHFDGHYGMDDMDSDEISPLQGSIAPADFFNEMNEIVSIKPEPEWTSQSGSVSPNVFPIGASGYKF